MLRHEARSEPWGTELGRVERSQRKKWPEGLLEAAHRSATNSRSGVPGFAVTVPFYLPGADHGNLVRVVGHVRRADLLGDPSMCS